MLYSFNDYEVMICVKAPFSMLLFEEKLFYEFSLFAGSYVNAQGKHLNVLFV